MFADVVGADLADHLDLNAGGDAEAGGGDGLVGSLAAGVVLEVGAEDGFAGRGDVWGGDDEIHVDAADDDDGLFFGHDSLCLLRWGFAFGSVNTMARVLQVSDQGGTRQTSRRASASLLRARWQTLSTRRHPMLL